MDLPNEMKGRAKGMAVPNAPMQEAPLKRGPTQQILSAPKAHYNGFPRKNQRENQVACVRSLAV